MERLKPSEQQIARSGVSLKELIPFAEKARNGSPGAKISERVYWLAESMETEIFWLELNKHLAEDKHKRQSTGGVFTRKAGLKYVGPYTWDQVFSSLDDFLKHFDMRATEFLFRDFHPENNSRNLARFISATRDLAVDKFPRLRIMYWEDYEEILETPSFWKAFSTELESLDNPVAPNAFFGWPRKTRKDHRQQRDITATLGSVFKRQFSLARGQLGKRARLLEYHNFAQIVRDLFDQDLRTFLLNYTPRSQDQLLHESIGQTKQQIQEKILPVQPVPEPMAKIDRKEFRETVESEEFWLSLTTDIENHAQSPNQAYSLSYFLRFYDSQEGDIIYGKAGNYTRLATQFLTTKLTNNWRRRLLKPSRKLVHFLMWEFKPDTKLEQIVLEAKSLSAEMFPQDCLYVVLQTPEFWDGFKDDLLMMHGEHALSSFLRHFSKENPSCDGRKHKKGAAKYQRLLHRAYHEQEEFMRFISQLGVYVPDYKSGLVELFRRFAPEEIKPVMEQKLSQDYNPDIRYRRAEHARLLKKAKDFIFSLDSSQNKKGQLDFRSTKEAKDFRNKLWSASRTLKIHVRSSLKGTTLHVEIGNRFAFSKNDRPQFEARVGELRQQGLTNQEIADRLRVKNHIVEHAARMLAKRGKIKLRKSVAQSRATLIPWPQISSFESELESSSLRVEDLKIKTVEKLSLLKF